MINLNRSGGKFDYSDNDRYDDLDFTTGLREYTPPVRQMPDYRLIAIIVFGYLLTIVILTILAAVWKFFYCWDSHFSTCRQIEDMEPFIVALFYGAIPAIAASYAVVWVIAFFMREKAIAERSGMVLDRFGDNVPISLLRKQPIDYYKGRYRAASDLQRQIAQYQLYKGINTLTITRHNDLEAANAPLIEDILSTDDWRAAIDDMPHLLIYGPSKAGKSTLAQAVVADMEAEYVVIDPLPNKPGESKWGGIDFITLDKGSDEWRSIKAALKAIRDEDDRRRQLLDEEVFNPLVIIIDEVLGLVASLGSEKIDGKTEPIMSRFIRLMGYSARHRNIKIILIGQGKNLSDLGLDSATARNNYALIRAQRNAATNERSAYIVTDEGEVAIDVRKVLELSQSIIARGKIWKTHSDMRPSDADVLKTLLNCEVDVNVDDLAATMFEQSGATIRSVGAKLRAMGYTISNKRLQEIKREA